MELYGIFDATARTYNNVTDKITPKKKSSYVHLDKFGEAPGESIQKFGPTAGKTIAFLPRNIGKVMMESKVLYLPGLGLRALGDGTHFLAQKPLEGAGYLVEKTGLGIAKVAEVPTNIVWGGAKVVGKGLNGIFSLPGKIV